MEIREILGFIFCRFCGIVEQESRKFRGKKRKRRNLRTNEESTGILVKFCETCYVKFREKTRDAIYVKIGEIVFFRRFCRIFYVIHAVDKKVKKRR